MRRRFQQNQEDCTFTVLALLPTATENILEALPVESITNELQQKKAERLGRSEGGLSDPSSATSGGPSATDDDGKSLSSFRSESYVHASQMGASSTGSAEAPKKSKVQLWNDLKINCQPPPPQPLFNVSKLTNPLSNNPRLHPPLHPLTPHPPYTHPTQSTRPPQLPLKYRLPSLAPLPGAHHKPREPRR